MNTPLQFVKNPNDDHGYTVVQYVPGQGHYTLGYVWRTGSLPSCQRWWAVKEDGQPAGVSQRTRIAAARQLA